MVRIWANTPGPSSQAGDGEDLFLCHLIKKVFIQLCLFVVVCWFVCCLLFVGHHLVWLGRSLTEAGPKSLVPVVPGISPEDSNTCHLKRKPDEKKKKTRWEKTGENMRNRWEEEGNRDVIKHGKLLENCVTFTVWGRSPLSPTWVKI